MKQPAKFTVDTISAGQGDVMVFIEDPEGNKEEVCWRRLPLSVSHGTFGSYRARDCVSVFLIKAHSKSFSFFFFLKKERILSLIAIKFTCLPKGCV